MQSAKFSVLNPVNWDVWRWWFYITALYWFLSALNLPFAGLVGLFVPIGFFTVILGVINPAWWLYGMAGFALMFFVDNWMKKANISGGKRVLVCLVTLLVVTFIVDLYWWRIGSAKCFYPSWQIFQGYNQCGTW